MNDLKQRTMVFALEAIKQTETLPSKSTADFIANMGTVEEEADECIYWLELLTNSNLVTREAVDTLIHEANQLTAITIASIKTARQRLTQSRPSR